MAGTTTIIPVKFSPNVNLNNPYSRNYSGVLGLEYDEHPNKVLKDILQNRFTQYKNCVYLISGQNSMQRCSQFPEYYITLQRFDY